MKRIQIRIRNRFQFQLHVQFRNFFKSFSSSKPQIKYRGTTTVQSQLLTWHLQESFFGSFQRTSGPIHYTILAHYAVFVFKVSSEKKKYHSSLIATSWEQCFLVFLYIFEFVLQPYDEIDEDYMLGTQSRK